MTSQPQTAVPPDPDGPAADLLAGLTAVLADTLDVEPGRIDPRQPFQVLGVDSIFAAEFVTALNARFGTAVTAAALYEHPAPADLARHLATAGAQDRTGGTGTSAVPARSGADAVLAELRGHLAATVHCDPCELDPETAFPLLGLDSILAAEFVAAVNRAYGLTERPVTLYDHPSLAAMAEYIAGAVPGAPEAAEKLAAPVAAPDAARGDLTRDEVNALLDAVRDDMLTVDEAVTLLTPRAA
ncbi:acyl carrier protein [Streptomyces sp. b94]|uniref:acyl carrier protein n=1 Tax=Streptomyces sp. b94 TaxID=1827634 RepID=UPI001B37731C|nr:acyl carrier protein [Streptomyces sp. b94]MBQ1099188.1 acyl carrier protein [Streptomyces sp. b94]